MFLLSAILNLKLESSNFIAGSSIRDISLFAKDWILDTFNKEGIAIFVIFCLAIFGMATIAVIWAIDNGEFKDIEAAKFEMMES